MTQAARLAALLIAAPAVLAPDRAGAEPADLSTARCADLVRASAPEQREVILWLSGYYAGAAGRPIVDRQWIEAATVAVPQVCAQRREMALIGLEMRALIVGEASVPPPAPNPSAQLPAAQVPPAPAAESPAPIQPGRRVPRPLAPQ